MVSLRAVNDPKSKKKKGKRPLLTRRNSIVCSRVEKKFEKRMKGDASP